MARMPTTIPCEQRRWETKLSSSTAKLRRDRQHAGHVSRQEREGKTKPRNGPLTSHFTVQTDYLGVNAVKFWSACSPRGRRWWRTRWRWRTPWPGPACGGWCISAPRRAPVLPAWSWCDRPGPCLGPSSSGSWVSPESCNKVLKEGRSKANSPLPVNDHPATVMCVAYIYRAQ